MSEPVGNTCPDIDRALDLLTDVGSILEELRSDNERLREWGNQEEDNHIHWEGEYNSIKSDYDFLENEHNALKTELDELKKTLEAVESQT